MRKSESRKEHKKELSKANCWTDAVSSSGSSSSQTTTDHNTTQAGSRIQQPTDHDTSQRRLSKSFLVASSHNNNLTILPFWEAHTKACIDSQRRQEEEEETSASSLVATSRRVLEYHHDQARVMERPTVAQAVLWNTNAAKQAVIDQLESDQNKSTKKNSSNWWPSSSSTLLLSGTVTKAYNFLMDKDDDDDDFQEEDDNANDNQDLVDFESPLLNVGLASDCCRTIGKHITSTTTTYATALPHVVSGQEGLREWCRQQQQQQQKDDEPTEPSLLTVISQLPDDQLDFLIAVMVDQNRIVQSNNNDDDDNLLVLLGTNEMENDPVALRSRIDTAVAYFRLDRAQQQTEANLERWRNQIGVALARAQAYKRQGRKAQALTELRKKALWEGHMETAQAALMNLEQTRTALETAANQQELLQDLSTTTETLRATRGNDNSAENVDAVAVDLQEELEVLHLNSAAASQQQQSYAVGEDEEELLKELEDLMGEDAEYLEKTTTTTTPAKTEKKKKKKKKESPPRSKPRSKRPSSKKEKKSATPPMAASIF